jgi:hypothetical protein
MEQDEWEIFIVEWVDSLRQTYTDVHRCGGSRDQGRDVIGFRAGINPHGLWDNYQCKHYANPLSIADVVAELGKLLYHVSQGDFSLPSEYYFVAPRGPSTTLLKCLQKGTLKQELLTRWDKECRTTIARGQTIERSTVQPTIDAFDFAKVTVLSPLQVIAGHQTTKYYALRFGGGLPSRATPVPPPAKFQENETIYIKKLLDAYTDERNTPFTSATDLQAGALQNLCGRLAATTSRQGRLSTSKVRCLTAFRKSTRTRHT